MIRSSFANFTTARLAIQANQSALGIVGQNMGNAKTPGYTRQRLDLISINGKGAYNTYITNPTAQIGSGVWVKGVSQIRDPFLDTRYRMEMGNLGKIDKRLSVLTELGDTLDETDKSALKDQLEDLNKQLTALTTNAGSGSTDSLVRSSAETLASMFRHYSDSINKIHGDLTANTEHDINNINDKLMQIQKMNTTIKSSQVHGNPALELQDERNLLIDELSTYANIKVTHTSTLTSAGIPVDSLKIDLIGNSASGFQTMNLIDDTRPAAQLSFHKPEKDGEDYSISVTDSLGNTHSDISSDKGTFTTALSLLNDSGEYDTPPSIERGINYYRSALDNMANTFAQVFNDLNTVRTFDANGNPVVLGGPLFSANDGSGVITAGNLSISKEWQNGTTKILASRKPGATTDDNSNILNMINALKDPQVFSTPDNTTSFQGSFYECFDNIVNIQAMDLKATETTYNNFLGITNSIASSKDSVSGVNTDEEAMNMMQYNSALTAASRLMTTLDEALNTIINSMGVVGR